MQQRRLPLRRCDCHTASSQSKVAARFDSRWARIRRCYEEGDSAEGDYDCERDLDLERALKAKMVTTEALLRKAGRGGKAGKRALQARLQQWEQGDQAGVLTRWARDRERRKAERVAEATERRATGVGGRDDLAQLRDCVGIGAFGRAMRQLNSNGVADPNDPAVAEQMRSKHPQRGQLVGLFGVGERVEVRTASGIRAIVVGGFNELPLRH